MTDKDLTIISNFIRDYFFRGIVVLCALVIVMRLYYCVKIGSYNPKQDAIRVVNPKNDEY